MLATPARLPLTGFEHYMTIDDTAAYPMDFSLRADLDGEVNPERLEGAVKAMLHRHPLLTARLVGGSAMSRRQALVWEPQAPQGGAPVTWWPDGTDISAIALPTLAIDQGQGFRLHVVPHAGTSAQAGGDQGATRLYLQFHHATADGISAVQVLGDLLRGYRGLPLAPEAPSLLQRDPLRWGTRGRLRDLGQGIGFSGLMHALAAFILFPAKALAPSSVPMEQPELKGRRSRAPHHQTLILSAAATRELKQRARDEQVTVNDLLLGAWFLTLAGWNRERRRTRGCGTVQVLIPVNLRPANRPHRSGPPSAHNAIGYHFMTRTAAQLADGAELLHSIAQETRGVKDFGWARIVPRFFHLAGYLPLLPFLAVRLGRRLPTAILSNLGEADPLQGEPFPQLRSIGLLPPVRARVPVAMGAVTFDSQLNLDIHFDGSNLSPADAGNLLQCFEQELGSLTGR